MLNYKDRISEFRLLDEELRARERATHSFHEFAKQAWMVVEGAKTPFVDGWHIPAICEHLEAVYKRQIRNFLLNIPPRCTKSTLIAVLFPAWIWLNDPSEQFLCASYAASLSVRDSVRCRRLISSEWYQTRWGDRYTLVGDQNTKIKFETDKNGSRMAVSVGGSIIGQGGSILICDDPNNAKDGESEVKRESANDWWSQTWSTRLNDPKTSVRIVVQQRLH